MKLPDIFLQLGDLHYESASAMSYLTGYHYIPIRAVNGIMRSAHEARGYAIQLLAIQLERAAVYLKSERSRRS